MRLLDEIKLPQKPQAPEFNLVAMFGQPDKITINHQKITEEVEKMVAAKFAEIATLWPQLLPYQQATICDIAEEEKVDKFQVAAEWLVQRDLFKLMGNHFKLGATERFTHDQNDGFMLLTKNASLLSGGQKNDQNERMFEYMRIPSRHGSWPGHEKPFGGLIMNPIIQGRPAQVGTITTSEVQGIFVIPNNQIDRLPIIIKAVSHTLTATTNTGRRMP